MTDHLDEAAILREALRETTKERVRLQKMVQHLRVMLTAILDQVETRGAVASEEISLIEEARSLLGEPDVEAHAKDTVD